MVNGSADKLEQNRDALERGVFVILFGQFEKSMIEYFEHAQDTRLSNLDWTARRGWDVPA